MGRLLNLIKSNNQLQAATRDSGRRGLAISNSQAAIIAGLAKSKSILSSKRDGGTIELLLKVSGCTGPAGTSVITLFPSRSTNLDLAARSAVRQSSIGNGGTVRRSGTYQPR